MKTNRRDFIGFAAAFAATRGMSALVAANAAGLAKGGAKLRFGVVSDVHIGDVPSLGVTTSGRAGDTALIERAFAYFRDRGADGVVIAGDIADTGHVEQLVAVGDAWRKVFPNDTGADGRPVEKLFVCGNHDLEKWFFGRWRKRNVPDAASIAADPATAWRRAFGETWSEMSVKKVKGYRFVLCNTVAYPAKGRHADFLERHRAELEGTKPFFYIQHYHPRGTTCAPMTWGQDSGASTRALSAFPNAVAFSGHSHIPLVDDRVIWQGSFTSVGTASLRYLIPLGGRENSVPFSVCDPNTQQMARIDMRDCQHGEFVTVYDDCITIERRDFANGLPLGDDWVIPLEFDGSLAFEKRAKTAPVPQFAAGAKVGVSARKGRNRAGKEVEQVVVSFPTAAGKVRAFDYEVAVEAIDVDVEKIWMTKRVYSSGYHRAPGKDAKVVDCVFSAAELPQPYRDRNGKPVAVQSGMKYRFAVRPCNCWGRKGEAIYSRY